MLTDTDYSGDDTAQIRIHLWCMDGMRDYTDEKIIRRMNKHQNKQRSRRDHRKCGWSFLDRETNMKTLKTDVIIPSGIPSGRSTENQVTQQHRNILIITQTLVMNTKKPQKRWEQEYPLWEVLASYKEEFNAMVPGRHARQELLGHGDPCIMTQDARQQTGNWLESTVGALQRIHRQELLRVSFQKGPQISWKNIPVFL